MKLPAALLGLAAILSCTQKPFEARDRVVVDEFKRLSDGESVAYKTPPGMY